MADSIVKPTLPWYRRLNQMKGLMLVIVSCAQMLDLINVTSVIIILPKIMVDVGYEFDKLQWVSSAYALAYGAFLLLGGRLGDIFGHRNIYLFGVTWFSIWAVINGFAKDPVMMSVGRALQGVGAGFTIPSALAILTTSYPEGPERHKALSIFGGTAAVGSVLGVLLGGILGSTVGWRWMFYLTGIIGVLLTILSILVIPAEKGQGKTKDRRVDIFGMASFTFAVVALIYYLSEGPSSGWSSAITLAPLFVGIAMFIGFIFIERKIDYPIMPFHILRSRRFVASCVSTLCMRAVVNAHFFFASLSLQDVLGYTSLQTSLSFLTHGIGAIIVVVTLSILISRVRSKIVLVVGWVFMIASGVMWAQLKADSSYWSIPFPSFIVNVIGMGAIWLTCQINSVADAADEDQGVVGAVFNVSLQIGAPLGIAISNIVANNRNGPFAVGAELLPGYTDAFYSYSVMGGVGLVLTLILYPNSDPIQSRTSTKGSDMEAGMDNNGDDEEVTIECSGVIIEGASDMKVVNETSTDENDDSQLKVAENSDDECETKVAENSDDDSNTKTVERSDDDGETKTEEKPSDDSQTKAEEKSSDDDGETKKVEEKAEEKTDDDSATKTTEKTDSANTPGVYLYSMRKNTSTPKGVSDQQTK